MEKQTRKKRTKREQKRMLCKFTFNTITLRLTGSLTAASNVRLPPLLRLHP